MDGSTFDPCFCYQPPSPPILPNNRIVSDDVMFAHSFINLLCWACFESFKKWPFVPYRIFWGGVVGGRARGQGQQSSTNFIWLWWEAAEFDDGGDSGSLSVVEEIRWIYFLIFHSLSFDDTHKHIPTKNNSHFYFLQTPPLICEQGPSAPSSPTSPGRSKRPCPLVVDALKRFDLVG